MFFSEKRWRILSPSSRHTINVSRLLEAEEEGIGVSSLRSWNSSSSREAGPPSPDHIEGEDDGDKNTSWKKTGEEQRTNISGP